MNQDVVALRGIDIHVVDDDAVQKTKVNAADADLGAYLSGKNTCQTCAQPLLNKGEVEQQYQTYVEYQDTDDERTYYFPKFLDGF